MHKIVQAAEGHMKKTIDVFKLEMSKVRTGRALPSVLDHVHVDYYGSSVPLSQVANISASDSRTLVVSPWEKKMTSAIEKAILTSDLGLNPATSGDVIRVPFPPMTEERRKDLTKVVKQEAENARVSLRNVRRDANNAVKEAVKNKEMTEDEERRLQDVIQKLTDQYVADVEQLLALKEKDLMAM